MACIGEPDAIIETATVFIPEGQVGTFVRKFEQYAVENTAKGHPKHRDLVDRIQEFRGSMPYMGGVLGAVQEAHQQAGGAGG